MVHQFNMVIHQTSVELHAPYRKHDILWIYSVSGVPLVDAVVAYSIGAVRPACIWWHMSAALIAYSGHGCAVTAYLN